MTHSDIRSAIRELRKALGDISQERFARKLATTTRTVARWEAAESLSPRILSRLHAIALSVGARDAADFFQSKLRETLNWEPEDWPPDISENQTTPVNPVEQALVSLVLQLYRANAEAVQPLVQELIVASSADLTLEAHRLEWKKQRRPKRSTPQTTAETLVEITGVDIPMSARGERALEILRVLLTKRPGGEKRKK